MKQYWLRWVAVLAVAGALLGGCTASQKGPGGGAAASLLGTGQAMAAKAPDPTLAVAPSPRVALLLGNATYRANDGLPLVANDLSDMEKRLLELGFRVETLRDLDATGLYRTASEVLPRLLEAAKGGTFVFYYSGHGLMHDDEGRLVPVDAGQLDAFAIEQQTVAISKFLKPLEVAAKTGGVLAFAIFDTCRNNPSIKGTKGDITVGVKAAAAGVIVVSATQPNSFAGASDDGGRNSLFTGKLLPFLGRPGWTILETLVHTIGIVKAETRGNQIPTVAGADLSVSWVVLRPLPPPSAPVPPTPVQAPTLPPQARPAAAQTMLRCPATGLQAVRSDGERLTVLGSDGDICHFSDTGRHWDRNWGNVKSLFMIWQIGREDSEAVFAELMKLKPLTVGTTVTASSIADPVHNPESLGQHWVETFSVVRREVITIKAGTFDTVVIEWDERGSTGRYHHTVQWWYAPSLNLVVQQRALGDTKRHKNWELAQILMPRTGPTRN